jgi:Flp pilus assembly protein TadG
MTTRRLGKRGERGQSLVEFGLAGIAFVLLIFGMVEVGRAVWNYNTLAEAVREGARYAIVHGADSPDPSGPGSPYFTAPNTDTKVTQVVQQFAGGLDPSRLTVLAEWLDGTNLKGSRVKVTAQYTYEPMFNFLGILSFTMSSSTTMEITN